MGRRAMKRDNREGNAEGNIEEGARGVQAFVRGGRSVGDDQEDDVEVLQVSMDPGDQVVEEVDDEEAVGGAEEIIFEDAVGQVGVEQGDEEERLGEQDDQSSEDQAEVAEAALEDGPAL